MTKKRLTAGETLVEALVGMLMIALISLFLVTTVIAAASINASVKNADTSYNLSNATAVEPAVGADPMTVNIGGSLDGSKAGTDVDVTMYKVSSNAEESENRTDYYFYEAA